jgi:membrane protein
MQAAKFFSDFVDNFQKTRTTTLAASLAFYTALSLAPILILFVTISANLDSHLQQLFLLQVGDVVGPDAALTFKFILENAKLRPDLSSISGIAGLATLMFSAGLIFGQLRIALNDIFCIPPEPPHQQPWWMNVWGFVRENIFQVGLALGFEFLMIVSLGVSTVISATAVFSENVIFMVTLNIIVSGLIYMGLYIMLFRYIPGGHLPWTQSFEGGALTAFLFLIGKELIGAYLGNSAVGSAYGAAGSIVVLLVWVYYSALITFIGAHISFLLARKKVAS